MESVPPELILSIITYLRTDEFAYFSAVSKSVREYSMQHKTIDISQIIFRHSKKEFVSILKLLRFHPFKAWIFPESGLLFEHEVASIIMNMIQRSKSIIKSITFKPASDPLFVNYYTNHPLIAGLSIISSLQHISINSRYISIPSTVLRKSRQTLISITASCKKISKFLSSTECFSNLQTLNIQHDTISDDTLDPHQVFGISDSVASKFCQLQQLTLKKQRISISFHNVLSIIGSMPVLTRCSIEYCRFRSKRISELGHLKPSNSLRSLYLNTLSISKRTLLHIADCFGQRLDVIHFNQCALPIALDTWSNFAMKCDCIQAIRCDKTCLSIKPLYCDGYFSSPLWLKSKRCHNTNNDNSLQIALYKAFKNKHNIRIDINKAPLNTITFSDAHRKTKHLRGMNPTFHMTNFDREDWKQPKEYDDCALCGVKVASGFMNDHVDNICSNALIECNLCAMDNIKRCKLTKHWDHDCSGYEYLCKECFIVFEDRDLYYEHVKIHKIRNNHCRKEFHFDNVHSKKYRDLYCDKRSTPLIWKCAICEQRCMGAKTKHKCPKECIDWSYFNMYDVCELCDAKVAVGNMTDHIEGVCVNKVIECNLCNQEFVRKESVKHWNNDCTEYKVSNKPLSMMRFSVPSLYSKHVVRYWIRNEIEKRYKLYGNFPEDIFLLLSTFYVSGHNFTAHKTEHRVFNILEMRKCPICRKH